MRQPRIPTLRPAIAVADLRTVAPAPKQTDPHYRSPEHEAWRAIVVARAGGQCEWFENGRRCPKSEASGHRMFADHIVEIRDGGAPLDPANGRCLCGSHHTLKTNREKARRHAARGGG